MSIKKLLAVSALGLLLAGCKIEIIVPEGGRVTTLSGAHSCEAGETCEVSVSDIFFDETFVAEPAEGMHFSGWDKIDRGFCGGSTNNCRLFTTTFGDSPFLMAFLENDNQVFHLNPTFTEGGAGFAACEFVQSSPGGEFDVCAVGEGLDDESCRLLSIGFFGVEGSNSITDTDCTAGDPVGYCSTEFGDIYYYDHDASLSGLEIGCGFAGGEWITL